MHDALHETIDRLVETGMDEYDAIALITQLLEQEAKEFIQFDDLYKSELCFYMSHNLIN